MNWKFIQTLSLLSVLVLGLLPMKNGVSASTGARKIATGEIAEEHAHEIFKRSKVLQEVVKQEKKNLLRIRLVSDPQEASSALIRLEETITPSQMKNRTVKLSANQLSVRMRNGMDVSAFAKLVSKEWGVKSMGSDQILVTLDSAKIQNYEKSRQKIEGIDGVVSVEGFPIQ